MAIRDDGPEDNEQWQPIGSGHTMIRFIPDALAGDGQTGTMPRAVVAKAVTTTDSIGGGMPAVRCEICSLTIQSGTFPTPGVGYGSMVCESCSLEMGSPSPVTTAKRPPGRPRKDGRLPGSVESS